jgi:peptidoglycan/LPS O-acetylase OafA/YrhL
MNLAQRFFHLGHHRSLDGLRGTAILMVLIFHGGMLVTSSHGFIAVNTFCIKRLLARLPAHARIRQI